MPITLIEQAIKLELLGDTDVKALVGTRIAYNKAPQDWGGSTANPQPYIVIFKIGAVRDYAFDNVSTLVDATFQISTYSETYSSMEQTAEAVRKHLYNQTATTTFGGVGGFEIGGVFLELESDLLEREIEEEKHHRPLTFRIMYYESRT